MYIVYIFISEKDPKRYYIGFTENLSKRLVEHNEAKSGYGKRYAPGHIETYIVFKSYARAIEFEKYLKVGSGHAFLKRRFI